MAPYVQRQGWLMSRQLKAIWKKFHADLFVNSFYRAVNSSSVWIKKKKKIDETIVVSPCDNFFKNQPFTFSN